MTTHGSALDTGEPTSGSRRQNWFARGLLTNLLNPKIGIFYVSFLPQFVPEGAAVAGTIFLLAVIHAALSGVWFGCLIAASALLGVPDLVLEQVRHVRAESLAEGRRVQVQKAPVGPRR